MKKLIYSDSKNHRLTKSISFITIFLITILSYGNTPKEDVITLDKFTITGAKINQFWGKSEELKLTVTGAELIRSEKNDVAGISIDDDPSKSKNEFRPFYKSLEQWLDAVVRPYMSVMYKSEKDGFFSAVCDCSNGRLAFLFYEQNPSRPRQHIVLVVNKKGDLLSAPDTIKLVRRYSNNQVSSDFRSKGKGVVSIEVERQYLFLEGIITTISKPQSGMRLIYKNPYIEDFNGLVKKLGYLDALIELKPYKIIQFN